MYAFQTNIYLTNRCERQCPNCYYAKDAEDMTRMTAYILARWISRMCKNEGVLQYRAHFLGGEPFNNYEVLCYIIEHLEDLLPDC